MIRETVSRSWTSRVRFVATAVSAIAFAMSLAPASSLAVEWNQEKAVEETNKLVRYAENIKTGIARHYERGDKESARNAVLRSLMDIHHLSVALQSALRAGQGADETQWIYRRLRSSVDNARADAPRFPEIEEQRADIDKANAALDELEKLYS